MKRIWRLVTFAILVSWNSADWAYGQEAAPPNAQAEPSPAGEAAVSASASDKSQAGTAASNPDAWLHQAAGQLRLNHVVEEQQQEAKLQAARGHDDRAAQALAVSYAFTPLHGVLIKVAQAYQKAGRTAEARVVYDRLLADSLEPLLRTQATALQQELALKASSATAVDADALVRDYIERGKEAFRKAAYEDCIAAYAVAFSLQELPRLLFNLAQAYRRMGQIERAFLMYQRFLQVDPNTSLRHETEGYISELRELTLLEGPLREPRPKWRIFTGAAALVVGLGFIGGGAAALALNGQCATVDMAGSCAPDLDSGGRPILPRTTQLYATTGMGASLVAVGGLLAVAGTVMIAWPGKRIVAPLDASLYLGPSNVALRFAF